LFSLQLKARAKFGFYVAVVLGLFQLLPSILVPRSPLLDKLWTSHAKLASFPISSALIDIDIAHGLLVVRKRLAGMETPLDCCSER
jgi:hypothetical protein